MPARPSATPTGPASEEDVAVRARHLSQRVITLLTVAAVGAGTACGSTGGDADRSAPAPAAEPASPVPVVDEAAARKAALTAYAGYLAASRVASQKGDPHHPDLSKFLADPLLTTVRLTIRDAKEHGAMRTGKLVSDPVVAAVSLETVPQTVEIQDCLDATGYRLVYVKTKKPVPGAVGRRYLATATAARYPDGRWLVTTGAAHEDQPC